MNEYRFDNVNHIHTLDGKPLIGTSTMASVLAKPLTYWAAGLAVAKFGWINKGNKEAGFVPKELRLETSMLRRREITDLTDEEYLNLLDEAYSAHAQKLKTSAVAGTDLHAVMEAYVKTCIDSNDGKPIPEYAEMTSEDKKLELFSTWALLNIKRFLWSEGHCYSRDLWLGGISDCGFEDNDGKYGIIDFKSSKDVYLPQFWQCIGYAMQIEENGVFTPEGELIMKLDKPIDYVAVLPFGMEHPEVKINVDMAGGGEAVKAMLTLYKKLN